jgi:TolA-binding protein/peroxiredoxin
MLFLLLTALLAQDGEVDRILLRHGQKLEKAKNAGERRKADSDARAELDEFLQRAPQHADAPRAAWLKAASWMSSGDSERAVAELRAFLKERSDHDLAHTARLALAETLLLRRDWAGAREACAEVIGKIPKDERAVHARLMTAVAWQSEGDIDRAAALLRSVRSEFPERPESWGALMQLAACLHSAERNAEARRALEEVIGGCPDRNAVETARRHLTAYLKCGTEPAPIAARDLDGKEAGTGAMAGRPGLVYFFESASAASAAEAAFLKRLKAEGATSGLSILGISVDRDRRDVLRFKDEFGADWPLLFDGKGYDGAAALAWDVRRLPTLWLLDRKGRLRYFNLAGEDLRRAATKLLQEN